MTLQDSVSKLTSPVRELVLGVTQNGVLHGKSDNDQVEVLGWIERIAQGEIVQEGNRKDLESQIIPRTYLVGNYFTAADVALYGALYTTFSKMQPSEYYSHPALTRYFDHIQSHSAVRKVAEAFSPNFSLVAFDLKNAPKIDRKAQPAKKKEKSVNQAAVSAPSNKQGEPTPTPAPGASKKAVDPAETKDQKKGKKDKTKQHGSENNEGGTSGKNSKAAAADDSGEPVPSMIDLRVGHIVDVKKHPDADGLYVEQIDLGEDTGPRTVVSGLVNYIPIEQMRDKYLVTICNLKPANMRGVKSYGMVLAASSKDGKDAGIELIEPPPNSKPGERIYFEGPAFENATPLSQLNPKKKIFETIQPGLTTLDTREAAWVNPVTQSVHRLRTKDGFCCAPTLVGASLS